MKLVTPALVAGFCMAVCLPGAPGTAPTALPKIERPLVEGTSHWVGTIKTNDQTADVTVTLTVKAVPEGWTVRHVVSSPTGESVDMATLDKQSLEVIRRESQQGPMSLKLDTKGGKVTGTITIRDQVRPVEADAGGPLFADGIAAREAMECLPLAEGYTTTYRNFDLQTMTSKTIELKVAASEKITVAAGTFDTFRVEVHALTGAPEPMTLWVAKNPRKMVKVSAVVGRSTIAAELK